MKYACLAFVLGCGPIYPAASPQTQQPSDPSYGQPGYGYGQASSGYNNGQAGGPSVQGGPSMQGGQPATGQTPYGDPNETGGAGPGTVAPQRMAPPPPRPMPPKGAAPAAGATAMANALVASHNARRAKHCSPPLTWSPELADYAQRWANTLQSQGCKFGHSNGQYGENLAAGSTGSLDAEGISGMWYDEIKDFNFKGGGFSMSTGHFTQLVWRGTTKMGCGTVNCNGMDIWVCEYDPAGNVEGEYRQNVISGADCR